MSPAIAAQLAAERLEAAVEKAHGVLGCLAFAFFFPVGGILLRLLPGRLAVWVHALWQVLGWLAALVTLGMGVWMAKGTEYIETYHAIVGIFVIAAISIQPITGFIHHLRFKSVGRRTLWSYAHMFWGIPVITLGIINGGFGLQLNGASTTYIVVYAIFAVLIWLTWMCISVFAQIKRGRATHQTHAAPDSDTERIHSSDGRVDQAVRDKEMRGNYD